MSDLIRKCSCLCGKVQFDAEVDVADVNFHACHCTMCQKQNGGPYMGVKLKEMPNIKSEGLTWYDSSDYAQRGFCNQCGSTLFWCMNDQSNPMCIVSVGAMEDTQGLTLTSHIFVDGKPDYYEIKDGLPCLTAEQVMAGHS